MENSSEGWRSLRDGARTLIVWAVGCVALTSVFRAIYTPTRVSLDWIARQVSSALTWLEEEE
jgi:hypothetical protein